MFYKLLGMLVWKGGKTFLRHKYGSTYVPKPLLAGVLLAAVGGVALVLTRRTGSDS